MLPILLAATALAGQDVRIPTEDGLTLHGIADKVSGSRKGVVLVHMAGRSAGDWNYLAEKLSRSQMTVVAPDLRGHGDNPDLGRELSEDDFKAMELDVKASVKWLRSQGVTEVSCAGASLGGNLCLRVAAADPGIVNVVMLSPGLNYKGVTSGEAMAAYGSRPVLMVASDDDPYAARSAGVLEKQAKGQVQTMVLEGAGHGTKMLNRDPGLEGVVTSWLLGTYKLASGEMVRPAPAVSADPGKIETTGTKLDMHK